MATIILYGSSGGNCEGVAEKISEALGDVRCEDIADFEVSELADFDKVILGSSTWGDGDLQDDFEDKWDDFCEVDFTGKTVALFGIGDQEGYEDSFLGAMGTIFEQVTKQGAKVIGHTSLDGYEYEESPAEVDGKFVGLAIDEDNQDDLTDERVAAWTSAIKSDIL
ncbi:MAG: Flavodoxin 1 [uncultured Campylobacterales bacterium]|uniref:Flavodoxin n=1 Tax=uncultured Campylobacterales bacterium TaxID=352960 RepID=A0A6S6SSW9_9BACT|nr:MAG: Flavodoxin 1 [uncultured Campylobacterales bacterium]